MSLNGHMDESSHLMAGKIGNPRFFHELGIAAQYAASVNGGLNTAAAQFFNFRDTAAVQRFPRRLFEGFY